MFLSERLSIFYHSQKCLMTFAFICICSISLVEMQQPPSPEINSAIGFGILMNRFQKAEKIVSIRTTKYLKRHLTTTTTTKPLPKIPYCIMEGRTMPRQKLNTFLTSTNWGPLG